MFKRRKKEGIPWSVPTDDTLRSLVGKKVTSKAVGDMKRRIIKNYSWAFLEDTSNPHPQRPWYVKHDALVSEASSAHYLLTFHRLCSGSDDTHVTRRKLEEECMKSTRFKDDPGSLKVVFEMAKKAGYLEILEIPGNPLRYTKRTSDLMEYFKLLDPS